MKRIALTVALLVSLGALGWVGFDKGWVQYNVGAMYAEGMGTPQVDAEAVKWYRLAAEQGIAKAQLNLGTMYYEGQGVPQDHVQAHMWFNLAAAQGDDDARKYRDRTVENMTPAQIAEAQRLAREWKPKKE